MKKIILLLCLLVLTVLPCALAVDNMLSFNSVKIYVDDQKEGGTIDVKPNSTVRIEVEVENDYSTSLPDDDSTISDIEVTATISGIDDGDDLEDSADTFDLKANKNKKRTITFTIPLQVDEDDYDLEITATGEDGNGTTHTAEDSYTISVNKEKYKIIFTEASISSRIIECSGMTRLDIELMNLGQDQEDNVQLKVVNDELSISQTETFDLSEDPTDDDNTYAKSYSFNIQNKPAGVYQIQISVKYADSARTDTLSKEIEVLACPQPKQPVEPQEEPKEEVIVIPEPVVILPQEPVKQTQEQSYLSQFGWIFVGFAYVIVIGIFIIWAIKLFKKE